MNKKLKMYKYMSVKNSHNFFYIKVIFKLFMLSTVHNCKYYE